MSYVFVTNSYAIRMEIDLKSHFFFLKKTYLYWFEICRHCTLVFVVDIFDLINRGTVEDLKR